MKMIGHDDIRNYFLLIFLQFAEPFIDKVIAVGDFEKMKPAVTGKGAEVHGITVTMFEFDGHS